MGIWGSSHCSYQAAGHRPSTQSSHGRQYGWILFWMQTSEGIFCCHSRQITLESLIEFCALKWSASSDQKNPSHICIQNRVSTNSAKPISRTHFLKISDDCYVTSHTISKCRWYVISINEHVMMSSDQCSSLCHSTRLLIYDHSDPVYLRTSLCKVY